MTFSSMFSHLILLICKACHFNLVMRRANRSFDNYVDKMRLVCGPKMSICIHSEKNVHSLKFATYELPLAD